jgi:hypothetical protein
LSDAIVDPEIEAEVPVLVLVDVESVRSVEHSRIAVGSAARGVEVRARRQADIREDVSRVVSRVLEITGPSQAVLCHSNSERDRTSWASLPASRRLLTVD